jgi:hypothetical protein
VAIFHVGFLGSLSSNTNSALPSAAIPLSTSMPEKSKLTPSPVSPKFRIIKLSLTFKFSAETVNVSPSTKRFPVTRTNPTRLPVSNVIVPESAVLML